MDLFSKLYPCLLGVLALTACNDRPTDAKTEKDAIKITEEYWRKEFPQVNLNNLTARGTDLNDRWKVTYYERGYPDPIGWEFEVEKESGRIIKVKGGQ
jgi:hypothetical protein